MADEEKRFRALMERLAIIEANTCPTANGGNEELMLRFSDFELKEQIGFGAFAIVYRAYWKRRGIEVAVKQLRLGCGTDQAKNELMREAALMKRVRCDQVLPLLGVCHINNANQTQTDADRLNPAGAATCLILKLARCSLHTRVFSDEMARGEIPWSRMVRWCHEVCLGLAALHDLDIIHRDVKSENILLNEEGRAMISDFGLSKWREETEQSRATSADHKSSNNTAAGTLRWMAPELLGLRPRYSAASDMYSVGVLLFEMASGRLPFPSALPHIFTAGVVSGERDELEGAAAKWVPAWYRSLMADLWSPEASKRPSALEAARVLAGHIHDPDPRPRPQTGPQSPPAIDHRSPEPLSTSPSSPSSETKTPLSAASIGAVARAEQLHRDRKYTEAAALFRSAAEIGDPRAQGWLSYYLQEPKWGLPSDYSRSYSLAVASAGRGDAVGQFVLGLCFHYGRGVSKDVQKAVEYDQLSASQGYASAQSDLGWCYGTGFGVKKDTRKAFELYQLAANQGYAQAQYNLGVSYRHSTGVEKDLGKSIVYYRLAADQGHAAAQCELGNAYCDGRGVPQDYRKAVEYYQLAVDQGDAIAQYNLALRYEYGQGVSKDVAKATELYRLAAAQGYENAKQQLARLGVQ